MIPVTNKTIYTVINKKFKVTIHIDGNISATMNTTVVKDTLGKGITSAQITTKTLLITNMINLEIAQTSVLKLQLVLCLCQGNNLTKKRALVLHTVRGVEDGVRKPLTKMVKAFHCLSYHLVPVPLTSQVIPLQSCQKYLSRKLLFSENL